MLSEFMATAGGGYYGGQNMSRVLQRGTGLPSAMSKGGK